MEGREESWTYRPGCRNESFLRQGDEGFAKKNAAVVTVPMARCLCLGQRAILPLPPWILENTKVVKLQT